MFTNTLITNATKMFACYEMQKITETFFHVLHANRRRTHRLEKIPSPSRAVFTRSDELLNKCYWNKQINIIKCHKQTVKSVLGLKQELKGIQNFYITLSGYISTFNHFHTPIVVKIKFNLQDFPTSLMVLSFSHK